VAPSASRPFDMPGPLPGRSLPGESLRAEAARRGVTVNRVRVERGAAVGLSPGQSVGKPRAGELRASEVEREFRLITEAGVVTVIARGTAEASLAGRRARDQAQLAVGLLSPDEFRRRWDHGHDGREGRGPGGAARTGAQRQP
jgi:hypothetical protein